MSIKEEPCIFFSLTWNGSFCPLLVDSAIPIFDSLLDSPALSDSVYFFTSSRLSSGSIWLKDMNSWSFLTFSWCHSFYLTPVTTRLNSPVGPTFSSTIILSYVAESLSWNIATTFILSSSFFFYSLPVNIASEFDCIPSGSSLNGEILLEPPPVFVVAYLFFFSMTIFAT